MPKCIPYFIIAIVIALVLTFGNISANTRYNNEIGSYWSLADKASTMQEKSVKIDAWIKALEGANLSGTNAAVLFPTQDTSFDKNLAAAKTLQHRLKEMDKMDPNSLAYQQAMAQVTGQEQGQANDMLAVFHDCWMKTNAFWFWSSIMWIPILLAIGIAIAGLIALGREFA